MRIALALGGLTLLFASCSGRRLPPGTPPPEYEPPVVPAWPSESNDAGSDANPSSEHKAPAASDAPSPAPAEPELSLDAGPR